jgi:hypothetical protein
MNNGSDFPRLCTQAEMEGARFRRLTSDLHLPFRYHRKLWEFVTIADVFMRRVPLRGKCLGFGVGTEPLPAFFAGIGSEVVATDAPEPGVWAESGQYANGLTALLQGGLCDERLFRERVTFQPVDMRAIPPEFHDRFDFVWSSCALEHLGTLRAGMDFVLATLACLRHGGWLCHTTEFNVDSNDATLTDGDIVLYRRRDLEGLVKELRSAGAIVDDPSYDTGHGVYDYYVDAEPFKLAPHLKLRLGGFTSTSCCVVGRREW